jgi:hypothetical protein
MPGVGFEPKTEVFERAKTVRALETAASVIASYNCKSLLATLTRLLYAPQHAHDVALCDFTALTRLLVHSGH